MVIDSRRATGSIAKITNGRVVLWMGLNNGPHKDTQQLHPPVRSTFCFHYRRAVLVKEMRRKHHRHPPRWSNRSLDGIKHMKTIIGIQSHKGLPGEADELGGIPRRWSHLEQARPNGWMNPDSRKIHKHLRKRKDETIKMFRLFCALEPEYPGQRRKSNTSEISIRI